MTLLPLFANRMSPRLTRMLSILQHTGDKTAEEILLGYPLSEFTDDVANAALLYLGENMDQLENVLLNEPSLRERRLPIAKSVDAIYAKLAESLNLQLDIFEEAVEKLVVRVPTMVKTSTLKQRIAELTGSTPAGTSLSSEFDAMEDDVRNNTSESSTPTAVEEELEALRSEEMQLDHDLAQLRAEYAQLAVYRQALETVKSRLDADVAQLSDIELLATARALFVNESDMNKLTEKDRDNRKNKTQRGPQRPILGVADTDVTSSMNDDQYDELLVPAVQAGTEILKATDLLKQIATAHPVIGAEVDMGSNNPEKQPFAIDLEAIFPSVPSPAPKSTSRSTTLTNTLPGSVNGPSSNPSNDTGPDTRPLAPLPSMNKPIDWTNGVTGSNQNSRQDMRAFLNLFVANSTGVSPARGRKR